MWRRIFDALTCGCSAAKKGPPIKEGFRPVCKRAPEPTDLLWQHASKAARENVTKRTILSIVVATVLLLVTFGFVYSMVLFKSNMAFEFEDAANAEEMAAAFGKGEGGLEEAGGLMSRLSFWLANWINEFAADYVSGNQMMTIVMSGAISCFTVAANFALRKIMEVMTSFERHSSLSNFGVSLLHKLSAVRHADWRLEHKQGAPPSSLPHRPAPPATGVHLQLHRRLLLRVFGGLPPRPLRRAALDRRRHARPAQHRLQLVGVAP